MRERIRVASRILFRALFMVRDMIGSVEVKNRDTEYVACKAGI